MRTTICTCDLTLREAFFGGADRPLVPMCGFTVLVSSGLSSRPAEEIREEETNYAFFLFVGLGLVLAVGGYLQRERVC